MRSGYQSIRLRSNEHALDGVLKDQNDLLLIVVPVRRIQKLPEHFKPIILGFTGRRDFLPGTRSPFPTSPVGQVIEPAHALQDEVYCGCC
jgi:hypothetical protein